MSRQSRAHLVSAAIRKDNQGCGSSGCRGESAGLGGGGWSSPGAPAALVPAHWCGSWRCGCDLCFRQPLPSRQWDASVRTGSCGSARKAGRFHPEASLKTNTQTARASITLRADPQSFSTRIYAASLPACERGHAQCAWQECLQLREDDAAGQRWSKRSIQAGSRPTHRRAHSPAIADVRHLAAAH